MNKTTILVAGKSGTSFPDLTEFFKDRVDWAITESSTCEESIEKFHQQGFDVVILAAGLSGEEEKKLRRIFTVQNPDIIIMKYHEIDKSLFADEILKAVNALRKAKTPAFSIVDDALKNAGLNINVQ